MIIIFGKMESVKIFVNTQDNFTPTLARRTIMQLQRVTQGELPFVIERCRELERPHIDEHFDTNFSHKFVYNGEIKMELWKMTMQAGEDLKPLFDELYRINCGLKGEMTFELYERARTVHRKISEERAIFQEIEELFRGYTFFRSKFKNDIALGKSPRASAEFIYGDLNTLLKRHAAVLVQLGVPVEKPFQIRNLNEITTNNEKVRTEIILSDQERLFEEDRAKQIFLLKRECEKLASRIDELQVSGEFESERVACEDKLRVTLTKIFRTERERFVRTGTKKKKSVKIEIPIFTEKIIQHIDEYADDPEYFSEEHYLKMGFYFPRMQRYADDQDKLFQLRRKLDEVEPELKSEVENSIIQHTHKIVYPSRGDIIRYCEKYNVSVYDVIRN